MKDTRGITLISLIITIIVLLILVGITIATLNGNGILKRVLDAKQKTENAQELENEILIEYEKDLEASENEMEDTEETGETVEGNLNIISRSFYEADGFSQENRPENIIDESMENGNGKNWYGGTRFLLQYYFLSTINSIGVYTTSNWGTSFKEATIYYSEDDTLTLNSDLSKFKSVKVKTQSMQILPQEIKAKRVMLIKESGNSVYEFQCFGTSKKHVNFNIANRKSFCADGFGQENRPENIIDDSMEKGNGKNWYGGTKFLLEYNNISTINGIAVYTTNNWGTDFGEATIYYSEDDSLTLNSDLSQFKSIKVKTQSMQTLPQEIKAKRVMLIKESGNAVYEFQCFGKSIK